MEDTLPSIRTGPDPLVPGSRLGAYRLISVLGEGGMGQVFVAEHSQLGRRVALKALKPQLATNPEAVRRFFREAQLVNRIDSEHIVPVHDFGQEPDGQIYFIMDLLEGADLATTREKDGPFPVARVAAIGRQTAGTLAAAHKRKIIHRDIKPENIFLSSREGPAGERFDFVRLLDFGVAKLAESTAGLKGPSTLQGAILGTPAYMSPEQSAGRDIDRRSDVYSLGIVLYWMLSDDLPHRAESFVDLLLQRQTTPAPRLREKSVSGESMPPILATLVDRCLQREPGLRPSMIEIVEQLGPLRRGAEIELSSPGRPRIKGDASALRRGVAVAVATSLLVLTAGWWLLRDRGQRPPVPAVMLPASQPTSEPEVETPPPHQAPVETAKETAPPDPAAHPPAKAPSGVPAVKQKHPTARHPKRTPLPPANHPELANPFPSP